ncbi:opioid growth factor receptor conserved region-domain-containing protein [Suillus fuscotomentosus]|uniref:Opioid growth factor receptor conserved region-domain-containing protein n=1 Tax=Suillus fuscotomentosus TaxID=1912939 RepID=A0AAD4EI27_9AGAM|nr:opioid growth factor receptor conserved region-domain-containing protein [Suillus fuscotomentosus]KAG1906625.1 opioid growth factor receptor conserved region-domain-containing protein [Suillus fuscotomentosus]
MSLPRDIRAFLSHYHGQTDDSQALDNLLFYQNRLRCQPDDLLISEIHQSWRKDYNQLEYNHGYIQWVFPIRENGMNFEAQALQLHEATAMKEDSDVIERIKASYELMLDFYGMCLVNFETGLVGRSEGYKTRYQNLLQAPHNNLRITRILKCLSEMDLEHLNAGFLLHVLNEQSEHKQLNTSLLRDSMDRWWANCLRNKADREWIGLTIKKGRNGETFSREKYEASLQRRKESGSIAEPQLECTDA